jgi:D-alanine-D-alanine ligase
MSKKLTIGVVFGGRSGEHEVSIVSAESVMKALDKKKYKVVPIGITKKGQWLSGSQSINFLKEGLALVSKKIPDPAKNIKPTFLLPDPEEKSLVVVKQQRGVEQIKTSENINVFFPVLHGPYGEDGTIQGLLEMANKPYVGANVLGSAVGMDKVIQKKIFEQAGLPVCQYDWFLKSDWLKNRSNILRRLKKINFPVFVKPPNLGSSVGISKAHNRQELIKAINLAARFDRKILVEKAVPNTREIECSILGNDNPKASVLGEIVSSNEFYDYDAKYVDGKSQAYIPAKLSAKLNRQTRALAIQAFKALDLCGMARVDFLLDNKRQKIYLNEVNTIPGFTSISMYPKLWATTGLPYPKLLDELIKLALERWQEKNNLATSFDSGSDWYKNS